MCLFHAESLAKFRAAAAWLRYNLVKVQSPPEREGGRPDRARRRISHLPDVRPVHGQMYIL